MKKFGIIGAMEVEVNFLKSKLVNLQEKTAGNLTFYSGKMGNAEIVLVRSGIGKVNAALCAQRLILEFGVTHIINTGIAGAMAHGLKVLDFVISTDAVYHDMDCVAFGYKPTVIPQMECSAFPADNDLVELAKKSFASLGFNENHQIMAGRIASGDQFIADKSVKSKIAQTCCPACVEMEGAAIAHACWLNKIPFVVIRCLSDMADDTGDTTYSFNEQEAADLSARLVEKLVLSGE